MGRDCNPFGGVVRYRRFNPRARVGRDQRHASSASKRRCFNPRARVGRDHHNSRATPVVGNVSIHAPAWGATIGLLNDLRRALESFNPRARVGRDGTSACAFPTNGCFNPRARVGRDELEQFCLTVCLFVSIHAPAWGATSSRLLNFVWRDVSIHAPAWGATVKVDTPLQGPPGFNPRARVGRDRWNSAQSARKVAFQSTRPRGARQFVTMSGGLVKPEFQSTRPRGARPLMLCAAREESRFQSTRPRGARPIVVMLLSSVR